MLACWSKIVNWEIYKSDSAVKELRVNKSLGETMKIVHRHFICLNGNYTNLLRREKSRTRSSFLVHVCNTVFQSSRNPSGLLLQYLPVLQSVDPQICFSGRYIHRRCCFYQLTESFGEKLSGLNILRVNSHVELSYRMTHDWSPEY